MSHNDTETRLVNLEISLSQQDRQIADLSEMVEKQWKEIDRLKLRLEGALAKIADMEQSSGDDKGKGLSSIEIAAANKPPHY